MLIFDQNAAKGRSASPSSLEGDHASTSSFFALCGSARGHLHITTTHLQFYTGVKISGGPRIPKIDIELSRLTSMRKTQGLMGTVGLEGLGDGLQIAFADNVGDVSLVHERS